MHSLLTSFHASTQKLYLIRPAILILVLCKNMLGLTYSALSMCLEGHLFSNNYCDSNLGSISPCSSKSAVDDHSVIANTLHIKLAVKFIFYVEVLSLQISSSYPYTYICICLCAS